MLVHTGIHDFRTHREHTEHTERPGPRYVSRIAAKHPDPSHGSLHPFFLFFLNFLHVALRGSLGIALVRRGSRRNGRPRLAPYCSLPGPARIAGVSRTSRSASRAFPIPPASPFGPSRGAFASRATPGRLGAARGGPRLAPHRSRAEGPSCPQEVPAPLHLPRPDRSRRLPRALREACASLPRLARLGRGCGSLRIAAPSHSPSYFFAP